MSVDAVDEGEVCEECDGRLCEECGECHDEDCVNYETPEESCPGYDDDEEDDEDDDDE